MSPGGRVRAGGPADLGAAPPRVRVGRRPAGPGPYSFPMRFLKALLLLTGLVGLGVAGYYLFNAWVDIRSMMAIANANRSAEFASPWTRVITSFWVGALGGLLAGAGLALPLRTAGEVRRKALQDSADSRELEIRDRAAAAREPRGGIDADPR